MITDTSILVFDLIIFLGVFQGIFISWFFIQFPGAKYVESAIHRKVLKEMEENRYFARNLASLSSLPENAELIPEMVVER